MQAFAAHLMAQVRAEQAKHTEAVVKQVVKAVKPYEKRIAHLEQQLAAAQADVVGAIGKALGSGPINERPLL